MREIAIRIDNLTHCLRNRRTREIVKTEYCPVTLSEVKGLNKKGWRFDWTLPFGNGYTVYRLSILGDKEIQGLVALKTEKETRAVNIDIVESAPANIGRGGRYEGVGGHLFAIAAKISIENGFGGYTYFITKSTLAEHYNRELGARMVNPRLRIMAIEEEAAQALVKRYFKEGVNIKMLERNITRNMTLDEAANGIYTEHATVKVSYKFKELFDYCKQKGVKQPADLSEEELKRFEV